MLFGTTDAPAKTRQQASASAVAKRAQSWVEGAAVLATRQNLVSHDASDAWEAVIRCIMMAPTEDVSQQQQQQQSDHVVTFEGNDNNKSNDFFEQLSSCCAASRRFAAAGSNNQARKPLDLETEQVLTAHRNLLQAQERLKRDQLGLASLVSRATENLDLGGEGGGGSGGADGLSGPSVARLRSAAGTIESALATLRAEEKALGDVTAEAERAVANVTKKIMVRSNSNNTKQPQQEHHHQYQHQQHVDPTTSTSMMMMMPSSGINNTRSENHHHHHHHNGPPPNSTSSSYLSADTKLKTFLQRVGGKTFGWPKNEHDVFMHVLFSGGFEDAAHTHATPTLGLKLADDDEWVCACVVQKVSQILVHRLPDDIKKHFRLQRELEFLEAQRRLEVKSWRDQKEADATLDLGVAAALAREDAAVDERVKQESEYERRQRQGQLHELVERWKQKKADAAATASAAMAMTERALQEAKVSRRAAIQAATAERNKQLLERRKMQKSAALWSTCAKQLGGSGQQSGGGTSSFAGGGNCSPLSSSDPFEKQERALALRERRENDLNKARQRHAVVAEQEKRKGERERKMMLAAEVAKATTTTTNTSSSNNKHLSSSRDPNRLFAPTASTQHRYDATVYGDGTIRHGETDGNVQQRVLCRKTPYMTPRTMSSHRRAAPFA